MTTKWVSIRVWASKTRRVGASRDTSLIAENHFHVHLNKENPHITLLFTPVARIQGFVESYPDIDFNDYAELSSYSL